MPEDNGSSQDIYEMSLKAESGELGLRDRHKLDKLRRISTATKELFAERGYEGTTLREIAKRAEVALGTLSLYADDKRDLIVMLFNQLVPPLLDNGSKTINPEATLHDNMVNYFTPFYDAYANDVTLYRIILGQLFNRPTSIHAKEHARIRIRLIKELTQIIEYSRESSEIEIEGDLSLQAKSFFYLYFATVRLWIAQEEPLPETGISDLAAMFEQNINGMGKRV